eukprot:1136537-Pelagomonas_calceolata.AAC.11
MSTHICSEGSVRQAVRPACCKGTLCRGRKQAAGALTFAVREEAGGEACMLQKDTRAYAAGKTLAAMLRLLLSCNEALADHAGFGMKSKEQYEATQVSFTTLIPCLPLQEEQVPRV